MAKKKSPGSKAKKSSGGKKQASAKAGKSASKNAGILGLIVQDHKVLKESIEVLTSDESKESQKQEHLTKFLMNLEVHAKTEEATLYSPLVNNEEVRKLILEGYEEHGLAEFLMNELKDMNFESEWSDEVEVKAKVLAEIIEHHAEEEEGEYFSEIRKICDQAELEAMGEAYTEKKQEMQASVGSDNSSAPTKKRGGRQEQERLQS